MWRDHETAALICHLLDREDRVMDTCASLLATLRLMSCNMSVERRVALAEALRDLSDTIEQRRAL